MLFSKFENAQDIMSKFCALLLFRCPRTHLLPPLRPFPFRPFHRRFPTPHRHFLHEPLTPGPLRGMMALVKKAASGWPPCSPCGRFQNVPGHPPHPCTRLFAGRRGAECDLARLPGAGGRVFCAAPQGAGEPALLALFKEAEPGSA